MPPGEHSPPAVRRYLCWADDHPAKLLSDESVGFVEFLYGLKVVVFRHGNFSYQFSVISF